MFKTRTVEHKRARRTRQIVKGKIKELGIGKQVIRETEPVRGEEKRASDKGRRERGGSGEKGKKKTVG